MQPAKFSNFAVLVIAIAAVSIAEKIASIVKVGIAGYPPPRPIVQYATKTQLDEGVSQVEDQLSTDAPTDGTTWHDLGRDND